MIKKQVLVVGGYGSVGSAITKLLFESDYLFPIIAGPDKDKAEKLAKQYNCDFKIIDIYDKNSIEQALKDIDIVICCYIDLDNFDTLLPETAIRSGVHYIDISGTNEYNEKIIALNDTAIENNILLITALGLYPGIAGLLLADSKNYFEKIGTIEVYFAVGANMNGLSELSLQGIGQMIDATPMQYNGKKWVKTNGKGKNEYIGEPFNKKIFFYPCMITKDLLGIPEIIETNNISIWSGSESFLQGMVLYFGVKQGYTKIVKKARYFLKALKFIGRNKNKHSLMKIIIKGSCDNIKHERIIEFNAKEEFLTAIAPVIVCEQIVSNDIKKFGAFTAPQVVNTDKFCNSFKEKDVNYRESIKKFKILPRTDS